MKINGVEYILKEDEKDNEFESYSVFLNSKYLGSVCKYVDTKWFAYDNKEEELGQYENKHSAVSRVSEKA
jgi:hypothetical protein